MNSTVESRLEIASAVNSRLFYMDNLRALAMLVGVVFHASLAHAAALHNFWLTANEENSAVVDVIAWFSHLFRMPVFFVIAGFFAALLVQKRGMGGLLKNRALRILLPLVIFVPLCLWAVVAGLVHAANTVEHKSAVLNMVAYAMAHPGTPTPPPTTMHLWFLYNLVFFYLLTWTFSYVDLSRVRNYVMQLNPLVFAALFPLLLVPALSTQTFPFPAPDSFLPQLWSFGFFGVFFVIGYWIYSYENFIEKFQSWWKILLVLSLAAYGLFCLVAPEEVSLTPPPLPLWQKIVCGLCEAYVAVWMTLVCLVLGKIYLNSQNKVLRIMSDSSYWIYLIHIPLLFAIQYQLMDKRWSLLVKLFTATGLTLAIGLLTYFALVRWTPVGWMLNGHKPKSSD